MGWVDGQVPLVFSAMEESTRRDYIYRTGPRESKAPGIQAATKAFITRALNEDW